MTLNLCFFIDIIINFISAYYDGDYNLIDDHRVSLDSAVKFPIMNVRKCGIIIYLHFIL